MKPATLVVFYWWRIKAAPLQELLAGAGIAAGVALVFSVLVANSSISGSVERLVHGVTGSFTLQLAARDSKGFDERLVERVRAVDGVERAAPILQQRVGARGREGAVSIDLLGLTDDIAASGGTLVDGFGGPFGLRLSPALVLPRPLAERLGARRGEFLTLRTRVPNLVQAPVSAIVDRNQVGTAVDSPIVISPLRYAQSITGLPRRITRVLISVAPGAETYVRRSLAEIAEGRIDVQASDVEIDYVRQAAAPNNQSTGLFAGICAIVGILFTFNAMLLTVGARRRAVAELRLQGFRRHQIVASIMFEAVLLGLVASAVGLALGDMLSRHVFHAAPGYLSFAFAVGGQRVVPPGSVAVALGGGVLTTMIATTPLLRDLFTKKPVDALYRSAHEPGSPMSRRTQSVLALVGFVTLIVTSIVVLAAPAATVIGMATLALAMLTLVPVLLSVVLRALDRAIDRIPGSALPLAVMELRGSLTRATALAATTTVAVFGIVAIQGAHTDLLRGLDTTAASLLGTTDVWVTSYGDENILMTTGFAPPDIRRIARDRRIADVRLYRGQFLDVAGRRVWVMARPPRDRTLVPPSQFLRGGDPDATNRLRDGGWAAISAPVADRLGADVGDEFSLPTPTGERRLRVAAIVSNLGWAPGSIVMNGHDYARWWPGSDVTAIEFDLQPGTSPDAGKRAVAGALGPTSALLVETREQRTARFGRLERQGLNRLTQISTLLLFAAVLAIGAAMAASVWQQRQRLAMLRMQGYSVGRVLRVLLTQAAILLALGATVGAAFGLYGQALGTRWLRISTGFPTIFELAASLALTTLIAVSLLALLVVSVPGYVAAKTPPERAFQAG